MAHALRNFIQEQMDQRAMDQAAFTKRSGLTRSHVSKLLHDERAALPQLPRRQTLDGIAKAFGISEQVVLAYAVEALGLGYEADDFRNELADASTDELLEALRARAHSELHGPGDQARYLQAVADVYPDTDVLLAKVDGKASHELMELSAKVSRLESLLLDVVTRWQNDGSTALAARDTGKLSAGQRRRAELDADDPA